jgi:hypothetical protein
VMMKSKDKEGDNKENNKEENNPVNFETLQ